MNISDATDLLTRASKFYQPEREPTIFDVGARGYFENPTSDLLAFFLDPSQDHGLGDMFLRAFLDCLPGGDELSSALREKPRREVSTTKGKRIDLVLLGDGWDVVAELKIFHFQVNPFEEYERYAERYVKSADRRLIYLVLSPKGTAVRPGWLGLSYPTFIDAAEAQLAKQMVSHPLNKWQVIARELLLHLRNITLEQDMDAEAVNFVFEHMHEINKLTAMKDRAIDALDKKILALLSLEVPGYERYTRRHTWKNGPALRYASNQWESWSDVVVYLSGAATTMQPSVRIYLCGMTSALEPAARELFTSPGVKIWQKQSGSVLAFGWSFDCFDERMVLDAVVEKMRLLMEFEMSTRQGMRS